MSKGLDEKTKYEINVYGKELNKDLTNLMECLRKQDEDKKAILYAGRYIQKIILPVEEYQKMYQRLEAIDNADPSEALYCVDFLKEDGCITTLMQGKGLEIIRQTLIKAQEQEKVLEIIKGKIIWVENDKLICGRYADIEIELEEEDFENKEEFDLLMRWLGND